MTKRKRMTEFVPGRGYTKEDWDEVREAAAFEPTDEELAQARPFAEVFPDLAESIRRGRGRPKSAAPKVQVSLRLDPDVLEKFRATGPGWQSRINAALREAKV
ncbi:BrnA antitoxin family protein [Rubellimicrobium sp. CFH 75288]|uniref:BrnA antitoxin family protein n=1 Tax=Rubellimicrobium sp. CFH 75288 TaxID=2697034 RepID=UPI001411F443|nr:BrnA antitoxin family protein [Rubellimicrobium sp. CFH 75288]NAZ37180.1 hypothetical protein [Rubellimicrobium sp. CFH 75288]